MTMLNANSAFRAFPATSPLSIQPLLPKSSVMSLSADTVQFSATQKPQVQVHSCKGLSPRAIQNEAKKLLVSDGDVKGFNWLKGVLEERRQKLNLKRLDARRKELSDAHFDKVNLKLAKFNEAILIRASFRGANLKGARFDGANLREAIFDGADLRGASFIGANTNGASFKGTILEGING